MSTVLVCKNKSDWLEARRGTIGASEVPTILGCNPWDTPMQLWLRKKGHIADTEETEAMHMGHILEPVIAALYRSETGRETTDPGLLTIHRNNEHPWLHASLDAEIAPGNGDIPASGTGALEIKAPGAHMVHEWEEGAPLYVQVQLQAQLAVCGMQWGSVAALVGGQRFLWADYRRNDPFIEHLLRTTQVFAGRLASDTPPHATGADVSALREWYPTECEGATIALPDEASVWDGVRREALADIKKANGARDWAEAKIMELMGEAETATLPGGGVYRWKTVKRKGYEVAATSYRDFRRVKK